MTPSFIYSNQTASPTFGKLMTPAMTPRMTLCTAPRLNALKRQWQCNVVLVPCQRPGLCADAGLDFIG